MKNEQEIKEWFEANYLDGDKVEEGLWTLSAVECLDAVLSAVEKAAEEMEHSMENTAWARAWRDMVKEEGRLEEREKMVRLLKEYAAQGEYVRCDDLIEDVLQSLQNNPKDL